MHAVLNLILLVIRIYIWLLIAQAILSWLLAFGVVNRYNRGVAVISDFLYRITEPALRPTIAQKVDTSGWTEALTKPVKRLKDSSAR